MLYVIKKLVMAALLGFVLSVCLQSATASAAEVYIDHNGTYWVHTETITEGNVSGYRLISVQVNYGMNKSRVHTYKFVDMGKKGWFVNNPGTDFGNAKMTLNNIKLEPVRPESSDNDILYVVLTA